MTVQIQIHTNVFAPHPQFSIELSVNIAKKGLKVNLYRSSAYYCILKARNKKTLVQ